MTFNLIVFNVFPSTENKLKKINNIILVESREGIKKERESNESSLATQVSIEQFF